MHDSTGSGGLNKPSPGATSDPLEEILADQIARQVIGMELGRMVEHLPGADILHAARELGFLDPATETHEERAKVVQAGRAALDRAVNRITARAMCLRDATECCVFKDGESCAA